MYILLFTGTHKVKATVKATVAVASWVSVEENELVCADSAAEEVLKYAWKYMNILYFFPPLSVPRIIDAFMLPCANNDLQNYLITTEMQSK